VLLEAENITKTFESGGSILDVLKGIDFSVDTGEVVSIVGPSGAGKSTLLHIIGCLDAPSKGRVSFEGNDVFELSDANRAKIRNEGIGFIFQFYHLISEFTALENVVLPGLIKEGLRAKKSTEERARFLLDQVGLGERNAHVPKQLSGGEQQRVAIARALINEPKVIFCDEPTGNLDSQSGQGVIDLLMNLNKENNQTLVIVTHDEVISKLSSRTLNIRDGRFI